MDNVLKIGILFSAMNRTAGAFGSVGSGLDKISRKAEQFNRIGSRMMKIGTGMLAGAASVIAYTSKKFADLESAQVDLQNVLRIADGTVSPYFHKINEQAVALGNLLPGTTKDMMEAAAAGLNAGADVTTMANGAYEASLKLGAVMKVPYVEATEAMVRTSKALSVLDRDMIRYADIVQRVGGLGMGLTDQLYAYSREASAIGDIGLAGIDAAQKLAPLNAMLFQMGKSGEEVGTGIGDLISRGARIGWWSTFDEMLQMLTSLQQMSMSARSILLKKVFGEGSAFDAAKIISTEGVAGYEKIQEKMSRQASLDQRAKASLGTMQAMFEGLGGTIENVAAAIGQSFRPEIIAITTKLNEVASGVQDWAEKNTWLVRAITILTLTIGGFLVMGGAAMMAVKGLTLVTAGWSTALSVLRGALLVAKIAVTLFSTASKAAMISTGIGGLVVLAALIYEHWDKVKAFFANLWGAIGPKLQPMFDFFSKLWEVVSGAVAGMGKALGIKGGGAVRTVSPRGPALAGGSALTYAPTVTIQGHADREDIRAELRRHKDEIYRMTESERRRAARRGY